MGRDGEQEKELKQLQHFNSHARVGRDLIDLEYTARENISTHTPAWGATDLTAFYAGMIFISTHTPAWGATL